MAITTPQLYRTSFGRDVTGAAYWVLLGTGYTPNINTHTTYSDVSAQVIADADYSAIDSAACTFIETTNGEQAIDSTTDADFGTSVTITAKYLVRVFGDEASPAAGDRLHFYVDLDDTNSTATVSSTNSDFKQTVNAGGFYKFTQAS